MVDEQEEFRYWVARTFFVTAWADWKDQYGGGTPGNGCDLMDCAPETPAYVYEKADEFIAKLGDIDALFAKARPTWKPNARGNFAEELGYCAAMGAMGHGVGWADYSEEFEGCHDFPDFEFTYFDLDDADYPTPKESNA